MQQTPAPTWHVLCSSGFSTALTLTEGESQKLMTTIAPGGQVTFRFFRREAQSVCIAGDFNNWAGQKLEMKSDGDGWWTAQTLLPAGDHRFRYWVDGQWFTDYASHGIEYSPLGINSLIVVPNVGAIERKG